MFFCGFERVDDLGGGGHVERLDEELGGRIFGLEVGESGRISEGGDEAFSGC